MARIVFKYDSDEIFLRDLAEQYANGKLTTDEYLHLFSVVTKKITLTSQEGKEC